jgi:hypothetical protein
MTRDLRLGGPFVKTLFGIGNYGAETSAHLKHRVVQLGDPGEPECHDKNIADCV